METGPDNMHDDIIDFGIPVDKTKNIIKVIGVGGGGCNAVSNMYRTGINNVSFAVCNTDSQALANSPVPVKLLLGLSGHGVGADPVKGKAEAEHNVDDIRKLLSDGTQMVFITAGMGGGTGTGSAPVVASVAKSMGLLTVGIVTIPFYFEKRRKIIKALKGVEEMRKNVDALLIINNERLCDVYSDSSISVREAVYLLFLNHPEGIEFKCLSEYKHELLALYRKTANRMDLDKIEESVDRLTDPLDNAINEKCSRIKKAFTDVMDDYVASYYIISSHAPQPIMSTGKVWYKRLKVIKLPRNLVEYEK